MHCVKPHIGGLIHLYIQHRITFVVISYVLPVELRINHYHQLGQLSFE